MTWESVLDKQELFYGSHAHSFKLGNNVWHAMQSLIGIYASELGEVIKQSAWHHKSYSKDPLAIVIPKFISNDTFRGYSLEDAEKRRTWLRFGTYSPFETYPTFSYTLYPYTFDESSHKSPVKLDSYDRLFIERLE